MSTERQHLPVLSELRRAPQDPRPPGSLVLCLALPGWLVWVVVAQYVALPDTVTFAGLVLWAAIASWWASVGVSVLVAGCAFLVADGFVQDRFGVLGWDGVPDALLLVVLLIACLAVAVTRALDVADARRSSDRVR